MTSLGDPESGLVVGRMHDDLWVPGSTPAEEMPASRRRLESAGVTRPRCMVGQRADSEHDSMAWPQQQRARARGDVTRREARRQEKHDRGCGRRRQTVTVTRRGLDAGRDRRQGEPAGRHKFVSMQRARATCVCGRDYEATKTRRSAGDSPTCLFWIDGEPLRACGASPVSACWGFNYRERSQGRRVSVSSTAHGAGSTAHGA